MNIRWSILALVSLVVIATQGMSYWLARDLLVRTVNERELEKIGMVAATVESLVTEYTEGAKLAARMLASSEPLGRAFAHTDSSRQQDIFASILKPLLTESQLDILEVTDEREIVRFRAQDAARRGDRSQAWGVSEALRGKPSMVAHAMPSGTAVLAIQPVRRDGRITGTLIAGKRLDETFLKNLARKVNADLALVSRTQILATSSPAAANTLDKSAIDEAYREKIPVHRSIDKGQARVVYIPLLIVDEGFVMMVRLDSSAAYNALQRSFELVLKWTAAFLLLSVLVASILLRVVLNPLRNLRARAVQTAIAATGESIAAETSDEIGSVVQVLDTLTGRLLTQNRDMAQARGDAQIANEAKSQFLSNMSHEIRTPLNGVLGMAELLEGTSLTVDQQRYCRAITASGRALHELLSQVLDLSKIEAGKLQLETVDFDLGHLLEDLRLAFSEMASARSSRLVTRIDIPRPGRFRGDPMRIRQVLSNLLGNAVKFTGPDDIMLAVATLDARTGDPRTWLRFSVRDQGIGITPEQMQRLFKPFAQADGSTTRRYGGTGLGLVISRQLVELLGGELHAESAPDEGAQFWFDLPLGAAERIEAAPIAQVPAPEGFAGLRVLLAEDNAVNQAVIDAILKRSGASLKIVDNGELAVHALRHGTFDIVLMDCQMPVMNGYEAAKLIRSEEPPGRRIPIIALTANAFTEDRERCLAAGMDAYLSKPVKREVLMQTIAHWTSSIPTPGPDPVLALEQDILDQLLTVIDRDTGARILRTYLRGAAADLEDLAQSVARRDLAALGARVHTVKSSSRTLGGTRLANLADECERLARAGDQRAFARVDAIRQALHEFCAALGKQECLQGDPAAATQKAA